MSDKTKLKNATKSINFKQPIKLIFIVQQQQQQQQQQRGGGFNYWNQN